MAEVNEVLFHRELLEDGIVLWAHRELLPGAIQVALHVIAIDQHLAGAHRCKPHDAVQSRGLARAVVP